MYEQMSLWDSHKSTHSETEGMPEGQVVLAIDGEVIFIKNCFYPEESNRLFAELYTNTNWRQDTIRIFGNHTPLPRLTAWYGNEGKSYTYSKIEHHPQPWTPTLIYIKSKIEIIAKQEFNSVLLNLYRDGKDSIASHSDDEAELGQNPVICSVSFGGTRRFSLRHKYRKELKVDLDLSNGSFLLMKGETQHYWRHHIPKTSKAVEPRINLTFRIIK